MKQISPCSLRELYEAFAALEQGVDVLLQPSPIRPGIEASTHNERRSKSAGNDTPTATGMSGLLVSATADHLTEYPMDAFAPFGGGAMGCAGEEPGGGHGPWLGLYSSGSTGLPKLVWHDWRRLCMNARTSSRFRHWTWASPFSPGSFAGAQVALQAWSGKGTVHSLTTDYERAWLELAELRVHALSCTPTYIDLLLQNETPRFGDWSPLQITLGGEVLRSAVGRRLSKRFPATSFSVIYAAAEFGVLLKTHRLDGWYESKGLSEHDWQWRVIDGLLEVGDGNRWRSTGDQVEFKGDLVRILGRADAVANVAGAKVCLSRVAELAEEVPGVRRAVASAEPNSITGQVVCLKYAVEPGWNPESLREAIATHLRSHLPKPAWPRKWELAEVGVGANAKRAWV